MKTSLSASHKGGFRLRLDRDLIDGLLKNRILELLGFKDKRDFVYEEALWIRPTPKTVCVRDGTIVFYTEGSSAC
jgi:hypothetical protein